MRVSLPHCVHDGGRAWARARAGCRLVAADSPWAQKTNKHSLLSPAAPVSLQAPRSTSLSASRPPTTSPTSWTRASCPAPSMCPGESSLCVFACVRRPRRCNQPRTPTPTYPRMPPRPPVISPHTAAGAGGRSRCARCCPLTTSSCTPGSSRSTRRCGGWTRPRCRCACVCVRGGGVVVHRR